MLTDITTQVRRLHRELSVRDKALIALLGLVVLTIIVLWVGLAVANHNADVLIQKQRELDGERAAAAIAQAEQAQLELNYQIAVTDAQAGQLREIDAELARVQAMKQTVQVRTVLRTIIRLRAQEQKNYEEQLRAINASTDSACQRWLRNCVTAKRLGIRPAHAPCECTAR